jgi:ABC-type branched-subunit amino acid transport system permease subunit
MSSSLRLTLDSARAGASRWQAAVTGRLPSAPPGTRPAVWAILIVAACAWPLLTDSGYWLDVGVVVSIYVLLALGMHVIFGLAGLPFVGYAGLFGVGAYIAALTNTRWHLGIDWAFLIAPAAVCLLTLVLGAAFIRLRDVYFMIVSLAVGELVPVIAGAWSVTGGPNGLYDIAAPHLGGFQFTSLRSFYYLGLVLILVSCLGLATFGRSRAGTAWLAVGRDDAAAEALGVPSRRVKLYAMTLGGLWAGLAGALYASNLSAISPSAFTINDSILLASSVLIGGSGSLGGTILGATALYALPEIFRPLADYRLIVFGVAIMIMLKIRPEGLIPRRPRAVRLRRQALTSDSDLP